MNFLVSHKCDTDDVHFQCDSDSEDFVCDAGLKPVDEDEVHIVADVIAWLDNNGCEPEGVFSVDLSDY